MEGSLSIWVSLDKIIDLWLQETVSYLVSQDDLSHVDIFVV